MNEYEDNYHTPMRKHPSEKLRNVGRGMLHNTYFCIELHVIIFLLIIETSGSKDSCICVSIGKRDTA